MQVYRNLVRNWLNAILIVYSGIIFYGCDRSNKNVSIKNTSEKLEKRAESKRIVDPKSGEFLNLQWGDFSSHSSKIEFYRAYVLDPPEIIFLYYLLKGPPLVDEVKYQLDKIGGNKIKVVSQYLYEDKYKNLNEFERPKVDASAKEALQQLLDDILPKFKNHKFILRIEAKLGEYSFAEQGFPIMIQDSVRIDDETSPGREDIKKIYDIDEHEAASYWGTELYNAKSRSDTMGKISAFIYNECGAVLFLNTGKFIIKMEQGAAEKILSEIGRMRYLSVFLLGEPVNARMVKSITDSFLKDKFICHRKEIYFNAKYAIICLEKKIINIIPLSDFVEGHINEFKNSDSDMFIEDKTSKEGELCDSSGKCWELVDGNIVTK